MSVVESDEPPSWSLDMSKTGESTKCPWVGMRGGKNRETVTASLCLLFTGLVAPATATPSEHSRALTTRVTENDIHHFAALAKIAALISEEFQNILILIICLLLVLEDWCYM